MKRIALIAGNSLLTQSIIECLQTKGYDEIAVVSAEANIDDVALQLGTERPYDDIQIESASEVAKELSSVKFTNPFRQKPSKPAFRLSQLQLKEIVKQAIPDANYYQANEIGWNLVVASAGYHKARGCMVRYDNQTGELYFSNHMWHLHDQVLKQINQLKDEFNKQQS